MSRRLPIREGSPQYRQLFRLVDGAVRSCFDAHPEFLPDPKRSRTIRNSIVKRVTGQVLSYAEEVANSSARVRSGFSSADDRAKRSLSNRFADGPLSNEPRGGADSRRPEISEAAS